MPWRKKKDNQDMIKMSKGDVRAPKGYVPVIVGAVGDGCNTERILVKVEELKDPRMVGLLQMAAQEFGYHQQGVLRIPCDPHCFRQLFSSSPSSTNR
ncbi:Small auxin-up RNA protein [Dioscorea alata]|uniref:Small auxin-up RNA protein n=1 Tax=Dioscorea alata TaxID=55571 RepID=A0ACB7U2A7_DIOAL|nr:Small auxin-up RNA protein [Dioscorea alata]